MTIGASIRARLLADTDTAALVAARMYPVRAPQGDPPMLDRIVYKMTGWSRNEDISDIQSGLNQTDWELRCESEDYDRAHSLTLAVITSLDKFRGTMGGGVNVQSCIFSDAADDDDPALGIFSVVVRFSISHN